MPNRPKAVCDHAGCPNLKPCPTHTRKPWEGSNRGSTWRWRKTRARILRRDPWCTAGCGRPSTEVHHVTPVADGGTDDPANLVGICHPCHITETIRG